MRFNPAGLIGPVFFVLALLCAWSARRDLESGTTRWCAWARLARPLSRFESPVRYWLAMAANIGIVLLFALVGAMAMRLGFYRGVRP